MPVARQRRLTDPRACAATLLLAISTLSLPVDAGLGGCEIFPPDNVWNTPIDSLDVDPRSDEYIDAQGSDSPLHPDFGTVYQGAPNGIPYVIVPEDQPMVPIVLTPYGDEADPGPYPIPPDAPVEGGPDSNGDRHVLVLQQGTCKLYEMYRAFPLDNGGWRGFGAIFDLGVNGPLRTDGYTSADAAGLPMLPGLVKLDEVLAALASDGIIHHAFRFTVPNTRDAYLWPARHAASDSTDPNHPPMGLRFRLKAETDIEHYPGTSIAVSPENQVILRTLKKYGMFLADNGSSFYLSGAPDPRWDDDDLHLLSYYRASDFEAVDESLLMVDPDSGEAAQSDADSDGDGVTDGMDDCTLVANADQRDTDDDGIGNLCDADLDQDCVVSFPDLGLMKSVFFGADPDADLNGSGSVGFDDLGLLKQGFFLPPGPSGRPDACDP
jgi:hypothetical protein